MNTDLNKKEKIQASFQKLLDQNSRDEEIEFETLMLSARFLSEIQKHCESRNILRKDLAKMVNTSPSFITQLFRGNKIINLETVAKMQVALGVSFEIKAYEPIKYPGDDTMIKEILVAEVRADSSFFTADKKGEEVDIKEIVDEQIAA